jgi:2-keto-4-pentenoate hydratase
MSTATERIAAQLIDAHDQRVPVERIVATEPNFDLAAAYDVLRHIETDRHARGWRPVGRKIGFTNRAIWELFGVSDPMWARIWDRSVVSATDGAASISLAPFVQPRLEAEVAFRLAAPPPVGGSPDAPTFEIVQCHFPDWMFTAAEGTAAFGLHGALVVGAPVFVEGRDLAELARELTTFDATISRGDTLMSKGSGAAVLGSPVLALGQLAQLLVDQLDAPLAAGEIITTGTITDLQTIAPGQRWTSDYGSLGIDGLTVSFTND